MGYSIIFETKMVKLPDGRIIHFDRSGCNNDDAGRRKDEFSAKIYSSEQELINYAKGFMVDCKPYKESQQFELKIGSRYCSMYDYGKHLLTMLKRALTLEEFNEKHKRDFVCYKFKGIQVYEPVEQIFKPEEVKDFWHEYDYGKYKEAKTVRYRRLFNEYYKLDDTVIDMIEANSGRFDSNIWFRIGW